MASKYQKLQDKHVLVIGGTAGIGLGVAEGALASGASVTISSSNPKRVESAVAGLKEAFPSSKIAGYVCDLSKPSLEQDIEALFEKTGKVDHIVFSAGDKLASMPITSLTLEQIVAAGQVRCFAPMLVAKVGRKYLSPGPTSSITLTTGTVSQRPNPGWVVPGTFATGLHGLTRGLALDLKPIRVNCVSPGVVDTDLWETMGVKNKEAMFKAYAEKFPTGRIAKPEDVAEAYLWLMKDPNVTGSIVDSNSGTLLT
ncbi:short chain dehydrogenase [Phlyctema vagabunda]|uniref:Short chain dehydrogenase n=1 Tax=Phlyctema vagabunda TaxID=108571 RepID=A0ABR4P6W7_9HELO